MEKKIEASKNRIKEIIGIILLGSSVFTLVSLISFDQFDLSWVQYPPQRPVKNYTGWFGAHISGGLIYLFGMGSYVVVALIGTWGWSKFKEKIFTRINLLGIVILLMVSCTFFCKIPLKAGTFYSGLGGLTGNFFDSLLVEYLGNLGSYIVLAIFLLISILLTTNFSISTLAKRKRKVAKEKKKTREKAASRTIKPIPLKEPLITTAVKEKRKSEGIQTHFEFMDELYLVLSLKHNVLNFEKFI